MMVFFNYTNNNWFESAKLVKKNDMEESFLPQVGEVVCKVLVNSAIGV